MLRIFGRKRGRYMKYSVVQAGKGLLLAGIVAAALMLAGCSAAQSEAASLSEPVPEAISDMLSASAQSGAGSAAASGAQSTDVEVLSGTVTELSGSVLTLEDADGTVWKFDCGSAAIPGDVGVGGTAVVTYTGTLSGESTSDDFRVLSVTSQTPTTQTVTGVLSNGANSSFTLTDDATGQTLDFTMTDDTAVSMTNGRTDGERATVVYTTTADGTNVALSMTDAAQ